MPYQAPTSFGLLMAHQLASGGGLSPYAPAPYADDSFWWGNQAQSPVHTDWTARQYQYYDPSAPVYQGLEDGDYARYENALRLSGQQGAQQAYDVTRRDMADAYTANGLYGSSQYTRQMDQQANRAYLDALTANAAQATAGRYALQQRDQQFASQQRMNEWQARMDENQFANRFNYGASLDQRDWDDTQAMRQVDFANQLARSRQDWETGRMQWNADQNDAAWNRIMGTWSQVDPEMERWEKKIARNASGSGDGGGGSPLGGLLGSGGSMLSGLGGLMSILF